MTEEKGRAGPQIELALERWQQAGLHRIGQIAITPTPEGAFVLCHREDRGRGDLARHISTQDAAELAKYDDAGNYRPLKTAPDLRHGWRLELPSVASLRQALDLFYPGRLAAFLAADQEQLVSIPFRKTLSRQSGMYRVAAKITDAQADVLIGRFCRSNGGCLRTIAWRRDAKGTLPSTQLPPEKYEATHDQTGDGERVIPLLCQEACSLLVSETRKVVKAEAEP